MSEHDQPDSGERPAPPHAGPHDLGFHLPASRRLTRRSLLALAGALLLAVALAFAAGYIPRRNARAALEEGERVAERAPTLVEVVQPKALSSQRTIAIPGSVQPSQQTIVHARASGYVREWLADLGDEVREGQVLAELDTPELDQELGQARAQLLQAKATLVQASANRDFAATQLRRYQHLASGIASAQDVDQRGAEAKVAEAGVGVAGAAVAAQEANIRRLEQLRSFSRVVAPFSGTITQRTVERGALVSAGNGAPLFRIAAMRPVRVFVQVPQDVAPGVRAGTEAAVTVREQPGRVFQGQVAHFARSLDAASRTMSTEILVPNSGGELMVGMYAQVSLSLPMAHRVLELPATALISDARGSRVAVVGETGRVTLVPVVLERDTGASVEIASGLEGSERVVRIANASLTDGMQVEVAVPTATEAARRAQR